MLWNFESPYDSFIPKWSQARQDAWDLCERQFYYKYRTLSNSFRHPRDGHLAILKGLKTIQRVKGEVIHSAISELLKGKADGIQFNIPDTLDRIWLRYLSSPEKILIEFVNGHGLTTVLLDQYKLECLKLLENFNFLWAQFASDEIVYIENHDTYPGWFLCGNIAVYARPDIILKRNKYLILDWKTGAEPDDYSDNILEMSTSIYLACVDFDGRTRADLDEVEGAFVYLGTKKISLSIRRSQDDFENFTKVLADEVNTFPVSLVGEHYTPDPAKWKCRACNFATICHDGRLLL